MKRVTRSMTRNKDGEKDLFSSLPVDLKAEILVKLPVKSVAKFICVSKFWSSIICSKGFTELYLARSSTRPRLLLTVARETMRFFHSYSQEDPSDEISITPDLGWIDAISPPVRGLICYRIGTKMLIRNNSTDQFLTLPKVKTRRKTIYHVFGYDPVNDLYKVLCMTSFLQKHGRRLVYDEHQVFTLGAKQKWRMIKCQHPHDYVHPFKGLCLNGVVYYIAMIDYRRFLISFDLSSEGFHVTKFPQDVNLPCYELVNYNGKIALTNKSCNGTLDLWVLEDASKQGWSKVSILVPSWSDFFGNGMFMFKGTISTGELIFEPCDPYTPFFFLYYDLKENIPRKVAIKGNGMKSVTEIFLDHVESPMILPKEPIVEEEGFKAQVYCLGRKMLYFGSLDQLYEGPVEAQASAKYDRRFRS